MTWNTIFWKKYYLTVWLFMSFVHNWYQWYKWIQVQFIRQRQLNRSDRIVNKLRLFSQLKTEQVDQELKREMIEKNCHLENNSCTEDDEIVPLNWRVLSAETTKYSRTLRFGSNRPVNLSISFQKESLHLSFGIRLLCIMKVVFYSYRAFLQLQYEFREYNCSILISCNFDFCFAN